MYVLRLYALLPIPTTTDLVLLLNKKFEGVSEVARADVVVGNGNVGVVKIDDAVPPPMGDKDDVSRVGGALHGTLVHGSLAVLLGVFFPILDDPFAHGKRKCYLVTIRGGKDPGSCFDMICFVAVVDHINAREIGNAKSNVI